MSYFAALRPYYVLLVMPNVCLFLFHIILVARGVNIYKRPEAIYFEQAKNNIKSPNDTQKPTLL